MDLRIADLKKVPRERWATVLALVLVQKSPEAALQQIVAGGRREFIRVGLKTDCVGLKSEDYSDIFSYIRLAVQNANQQRVMLDARERAGFITPN